MDSVYYVLYICYIYYVYTIIGNQKDRRIYVGNLPTGMTGDQLKDFMNEALSSYTAAGHEGVEKPPAAVVCIDIMYCI